MALTFDQLNAITNDFIRPEVTDNIYNGVPFLARLEMNDRIEIGGGVKIREPLMYQQTGQAGGFDGTGPLPTTMNEVTTAAEFDWVTYQAPAVFSRREEAQNSSKAGIVKLVKILTQAAKMDLRNSIGGDAIIGNDTATSTQELDGLELMVDDDNSPKNYGGVATTDFSGWAANDGASLGALSLFKLQQTLGDVTIGNDRPTLFLVTQDIFDKTWDLIQADQRFPQSDKKTADAGFQNLLVSGVPMLVDPNTPSSSSTSQTLYAVNENYITLYVHKEWNFEMTPWTRPADQWADIAHFIWMGQLTTNNRRMHARRTAVDPS